MNRAAAPQAPGLLWPRRPPKGDRTLPKPVQVLEAAQRLPEETWQNITWREGTKGPLCSRFAAIRIQPAKGYHQGQVKEPICWLLVEWPPSEPEPTKYWFSNLPETTPVQELVYWAKIRFFVEQNYQQLKDELGLDHFEGRSWHGWHRHVTLTMIAFNFLVLEGFRSKKTSGWTLPRAKRELQRLLIMKLGFCPCCKRPIVLDDS